ncbi:MAG: hypothetical protein Ct9H300mP4_03780 [Gammaproteobacteria bacterium]|nr:MAG: hypothetical protein Ct9H300mP4_03780 [Gammaproteobacteria bacterium]
MESLQDKSKEFSNAYKVLNMVPMSHRTGFYLVKEIRSTFLWTTHWSFGGARDGSSTFSIDALDELNQLSKNSQLFRSHGIKIDTFGAEMGTAHWKLILNTVTLYICDQVFMFKRIVREAAMHTILCTFMSNHADEPGMQCIGTFQFWKKSQRIMFFQLLRRRNRIV